MLMHRHRVAQSERAREAALRAEIARIEAVEVAVDAERSVSAAPSPVPSAPPATAAMVDDRPRTEARAQQPQNQQRPQQHQQQRRR